MSQRQADLIFDMALKLAVIVCLSTLALALINGADPLAALSRSAVAFVSFAVIGWAASILWSTQLVQQPERDSEGDLNENQQESGSTERNAFADAENAAE